MENISSAPARRRRTGFWGQFFLHMTLVILLIFVLFPCHSSMTFILK